MKLILTILAAVFLSPLNADVSEEQKHEIEHLMKFVKKSSCEINRNGSFHKGNEAVSHIKKKYEYFKDDIDTAEEFIEYAATKSTMSGK